MASIKIADLFAQIGARVDVRQLNKFQKRLVNVKRQLLSLKRIARSPLSPNTNIAAVRNLNTELTRTLRLARQIQNQGPIRVRRAGGRPGGGGRQRGGGVGPAGFFGGAAAAGGVGRTGLIGRSFVGGFGIALVTRQLFGATAAMEGIQVALGAVTREGQTTAEVMGFLRSEALRLGFDFRTSALEYAKLAAAGNSVNLELATVNEIFIAAQEASRVFNLSVSDTEGVLKAFTQIISKGKITAEELRNQLGDRLPGAVGIFASALKVTTQELSIMLEKGQVLADDKTLQAVAKELRKTFAKQIPAAARSLTAVLNRTKTALFEFSAALGKSGLSKIFISALTLITNLFKILGPIIVIVVRTLQALLAPFRALGRIIERPLAAMPKLTSAFFGMIGIVLLLRTALARLTIAWVVAFAPILATAAGLTALVLLIEDWLVALEGGDSVLKRLSESTNVFNAIIGGSLINLGKFVQFFGELAAALITGNFDELTASFQRFVAAVSDFMRNPISDALANLFEFFLLDAGAGGPNTFQLRPGSPGDIASRGGNTMAVELTVIDGAGLTEAVDIRIDGALDTQARQAEGELSRIE